MKSLRPFFIASIIITLLLTGCSSAEKQNTKNNNTTPVTTTLPKQDLPKTAPNNQVTNNFDGIEQTFDVITIQKGTAMTQYFIYLKDYKRDNIVKIAKFFKETKAAESSLGFGLHMYIDRNVNVTSNDYMDKKYAVYNYNKNSKSSVLVIGVKNYKSVYEEIDL